MWYTSKEVMWQTEHEHVAYYSIYIIGGGKNWVWSNVFKSSGQTTENSYINRLY